MGKIRKQSSPHNDISLSPALRRFIDACSRLPLHQLPAHLCTFPAHWPFPRGDLFNWIPVLNRFDDILEKFTQVYRLHEGPQSKPFRRELLLDKPSSAEGVENAALQNAGFSAEGDEELVKHILEFSRLLFENCANRRLYASSQHLDAVLNTTSLSLLNVALKLALRLAEKYASDRVRQTPPAREGLFLPSVSHGTLATHYQINLDKLQKLSLPFRKGLGSPSKRATDVKETEQGLYVTPTFAPDLLSILEDEETDDKRIETYGQPYFSLHTEPKPTDNGGAPRYDTEQQGPPTENGSSKSVNDGAKQPARFELIEVPTSELLQNSLCEIVAQYMPRFPKQCQYEFLCRLRTSKALCGSHSDRASMIQSRLLAVANYLNIFPESHHSSPLSSKIFQTEGDEIRRAKLSSQLCDVLHPSPGKAHVVPRSLQSLALTVLEGYANHQKKSSEAIAALGANVNHGVLTYLVRKAVNDLSEDADSLSAEDREWSKALFSLLHSLPKSVPRAADGLLTTGVLDSFVEALRLRTRRSENAFPQFLTSIDVFVYNIREAYTALSTAGGPDTISDLFRYEVDQAFSTAMNGQGMPDDWRSGVVDYQISFVQQATLRNIFKLLKNLMAMAGGATDRNLRNLIESSQLLSALRRIVDYPSLFGSNIWCGAVDVFSNFIHNEPTSYAAIAEAGLTQAFLGTVTHSSDSKASADDASKSTAKAVQDSITPQSPPSTLEAITTIPQAFGAICLNENGMRQFVESQALSIFFQDLLKPVYSKALADAIDIHRSRRVDVESLGASFDELARHHPSLKPEIIRNFVIMVDALHKDITNPRWQQQPSFPGATVQVQTPASVSTLSLLSDSQRESSDVEMSDGGKADSTNTIGSAGAQANLDRMKVVSEMMSGFFSNTSFCSLFAEQGGLEKLIDILSTPVYALDPPVVVSQPGFTRVTSTFIVQKPHLVVLLLLERLQKAVQLCRPLLNQQDGTPFLAQYVKDHSSSTVQGGSMTVCINALSTVRNILSVFTPTLMEPTSRHSQNPMSSVNVADTVNELVPQLLSVSRSCIIENALLQNQVSSQLVNSQFGSVSALDAAQKSESTKSVNGDGLEARTDGPSPSELAVNGEGEGNSAQKPVSQVSEHEKQAYLKIGGLLKNLPYDISFFLHSVGKCLALARRLPTDSFQRAKSLSIATGIATALAGFVEQPLPSNFSTKIADYARRNVVMASVAALIDKRSDSTSQFLTIVVWYFKKAGGIDALLKIAKAFTSSSQLPGYEESDARVHEATWAFQGLRTLFGFFMRATNQRSVHESHQTAALSARADRERDRADYFSEGQFLVEMRYYALQFVQPIWESDGISKLSRDLVKHICTILQYSLEASGESGAYKGTDKIQARAPSPSKKWRLRSEESIRTLTDKGFDEDLAREALYRCMGHSSAAQEYCTLRQRNINIPRFEIPADDLTQPAPPNGNGESSEASRSTQRPAGTRSEDEIDDETARQEAQELVSRLLDASDDPSLDNRLSDIGETPDAPTVPSDRGPATSSDAHAAPGHEAAENALLITVDSVDGLRNTIREHLVDRTLHVLNSFDTLSFELGDLIISSVAKAPDANATKGDISRTLLHSLISYQGGDDLKESSTKIASSAHLLGVVFQDKHFFESAREDLMDNVEALTQYLTTSLDSQSTQTLTWMSNILLIVEKMLCEDLQPMQLRSNSRDTEKSSEKDQIIKYRDPLVSKGSKQEIFKAISSLLPRVGKDTTLATSCLRVLVALTRDSDVSLQLAEKRSMQRLFVMVKQLGTVKDATITPLLLVILRQMVEDEATVRQIMRSEIEGYFAKNSRQSPTLNTYTRQLFHLSLRSPEIFTEVTNELVALSRVQDGSATGEHSLVLKRDLPPMEQIDDDPVTSKNRDSNTILAAQEKPSEASDAQPSTEQPIANGDAQITDSKAPVLPRADGVTAFLLSELLAYKDVQDREQSTSATDAQKTDREGDVEMVNGASSSAGAQDSSQASQPATAGGDKSAFKLDDHPIFVYRCLLMQCLTELLQSYGLAKLNFIAFSRKMDPPVSEPIKPRSGVLHYLLQTLIADSSPNETNESLTKKRGATCNWATNVLTALCARTQEKYIAAQPDASEMDDDQDLAFVRKFVLEHALKAYRDAATSSELSKEVKFAKLHNLAELFNRMLTGKSVSNPTSHDHTREHRVEVQKSMAKIMFEKHFIPMLTTSVSDLDQHTPDANRALKCILKALKTLTHTAIHLSETGKITSVTEQDDGDEISSASSTSDIGEGREETPDLFRNSTLGMFEPGREDASSSEESEGEEGEDDIYGDDYADDMEFDEEDPDQADGEVVSEDDEDDPDGMGNVEGLPGDVPMEVEIDIEDGEDHDPSDDDDEDEGESSDPSEDEEGEDGDDIDLEIMDDVEGDEEGQSDEEHDDDQGDEWQDEDEDEDEEAIDFPEQHHHPVGIDPMAESRGESPSEHDIVLPIPHPGPMDPADRAALNALHEQYDDMPDDADDQDSEDEDHEVDDEEDDYDEDEMIFGRHELDDDDMEVPSMPFQWPPGAAPRRHHHHALHHHHRHMPSFLPDMDSMFMPELRSHRNGAPRTPDDNQGVNPLLNRSRREQGPQPSGLPRAPRTGSLGSLNPASIFASLGRNMPEDALGFDRQALDQILQTLGQGGAFSISMHGTDSRGHPVHGLRHVFDGGPPRAGMAVPERDDPYQTTLFEPAVTRARWEEAARILFGPDYVGKSSHLVSSILRVLTPPALEREKQLNAKREERERKIEEQQAKARVEREEREAREKKEREEREEKEKAEREAAEAEAARLAATQEPEQGEAHVEEIPTAEPMEGVEASEPTQAEPTITEPGPSEPAEPIVTSIRGREVNITHLGIDTAYLEALPEELREEVIMQQAAEHRSTQPAPQEGQEPTTIDNDFLEALPPDIREEILQQEAQDRRRREREETRRRARESGAPAQPEDIDPASLIASLDPMLRQQVLAESDEDMLAALPPDIQAEARALGGHRRRGAVPSTLLGRAAGLSFGRGPLGHDPGLQGRNEGEKRQRTPIVQMLDKAGIAGLLRLMFVSMNPHSRGTLNSVLLNVCGNRQTRSEVINGLLSILQDGSADVHAVERCFSQLTLKAKQQPLPKTPQKKTPPPPFAQSDVSPNVVMDQSLTALNFLASAIAHIPHFFVTEHDVVGSAKGKASRKGKAKDTKAGRYPFMVLVGLLEREVVINNSSNLDLLSGLLAQITQPLNNIGKNDRSEKKDKKEGAPSPEPRPDNEPGHQPEPTAHLGTQSSPEVAMPDTSEETTDVLATEVPATSANTDESSNDASDNAQANVEGGSSKPKEDTKTTKKARTLSAPDVPAELLKPVVNMIMSRECNSKVFQSAIASMNSLANIDGARSIFKHELIEQARTLAQTIQARLGSLVKPLQSAETEIDAQSLALAELSPTGSDQTKFHRILTALDYLFQSEIKAKQKQADEAGAASAADGKDELMNLYEESSFMSIWNRLSDVLNAIKRSESYFFFNVATILLSLVESLMLVCKRISLTDSSLIRRQTGESVEPHDMPSVFFSFTNQHRKILNELVRHNPKLMSNNFSVLINNSGVLEFDNKRSYFTRRLHHRGSDTRHYPHPSLQLHIRRDQVFLDSYKNLHYKSAQEIKYGKFNIRFHNEEGVDAGGVTREWFQVLARQMFNPDYALFNPVASDRTTFHPNTLSWVNPEHLSFFKFIGRIIGKALYENRVLDCHFSRAVYKKILGQPVSIKDMETVDLDYSKNMQWMLTNDITDIITETFSITVDKFGVEEVIDLIPNGRNIPVTEENKEEYVRKVMEFRLTGSVSEQLDSFLQGFYDIVPTELISIFDEGELELLISGMPDVDVDDWRANTDYHNYNASSPQIQWFWRAVRSFDKEERARLLQFVTGTGKVPLNGFKELEGMNGFTRFSIHKDYGSHDRLPSSHTCFNQLDLPEYDSYEQLRKGLYTAMTTGNDHFGFA